LPLALASGLQIKINKALAKMMSNNDFNMTITISAKAQNTFNSFILQLKQEAINRSDFMNCHWL